MNLVAKKVWPSKWDEVGAHFLLYRDGFLFGKLNRDQHDGDVLGEYYLISRDEGPDFPLSDYLPRTQLLGYALKDALAKVREAVEKQDADARALQAHELASEYGWLRHAERPDPEAEADLALHDVTWPIRSFEDDSQNAGETPGFPPQPHGDER